MTEEKRKNSVPVPLIALGFAIFIWAPYQAYQNWTDPDLRHYADGTYDRQKREDAGYTDPVKEMIAKDPELYRNTSESELRAIFCNILDRRDPSYARTCIR
jgi:hypothetical protein